MKPKLELRHSGFAAAVVAVFLSASCNDEGQTSRWWQGEQERIELSHELELKRYRFDQTYTRDYEEFEKLRKSTEETASLLKSLRKERLALSEEIASSEAQWADFRASTIREQRQRAIGKTLLWLLFGQGEK